MKVFYTTRAGADLEAISSFLRRRSPHAADSVIQELRKQIGTLSDFPLKGTPTATVGTRRLTISRYPYLVFYRPEEDTISILHIRHASRRPWGGGED